MTTLIADCETDGLLPNMTRLWMVQIGDAETNEVTLYVDQEACPPDLWVEFACQPLLEGITRLRAADRVVFHNGLGFDMAAINRFHPGTIKRENLLDTLVLARLSQPQERRHTLRDWGHRLGILKGDYKGDYQSIDREFLEYSRQDIVVGRALFRAVAHTLDWGRPLDTYELHNKEVWQAEMDAYKASLQTIVEYHPVCRPKPAPLVRDNPRHELGTAAQIEHDVAWALVLQERNGIRFDVARAQDLVVELRKTQQGILAELYQTFPPLHRVDRRIAKVSNKTRGHVKGEVAIFKEWDEAFDPASNLHIAERLRMAGWKPTAFGKDGNPTVDEETLASLSFPEAKLIMAYKTVSKTLGILSDGDGAYLKLVKLTGRIHGRVNGNGTRTGRMSHSKPNLANVDGDPRVRSLFGPRKGWKLVGCDGEGIQLRAVAHYIFPFDKGALADRIINGRKEDGTDPHSVNRDALRHLGLTTRDGAKTTIYAKLFGSSDGGLAHTVKDAIREAGGVPLRMPHYAFGKEVNKALSVGMVGLDKLEAGAQARLKAQGYILGIDGRRLYTDHPRLALVSLCQSFEAAIMKKALALFLAEWGGSEGGDWGFCANVHDEVQIETRPDIAEDIGRSFANYITAAGHALGSRCLMTGAYQIGNNWSETH